MAGVTLVNGKLVFPKGEKISAEKEKKYWAELEPKTYAALLKVAKAGGAAVDAESERGKTAQENKIVGAAVNLILDEFLKKA